MDTAIADRSALENLVSDPDFEWLEARLAPFNLFEALGVTSQEVRHSDFLAFLLAPSSNHGLGSTFLKRFLQATVRRGQGAAPISLVDLDLADLTECDIRREWQSIDVLMLLPALRLAVIIENKIWSGEHDQQCARYWATVERHWPGWRILGLLLAPRSDVPDDERYLPIDYTLVDETVNRVVAEAAPSAGVELAMRHYGEMLRRHVLQDTEVADLARRLYRRHRRAFDVVFEHRPDRQSDVIASCARFVEAERRLLTEYTTRDSLGFAVATWDQAIPKAGVDWVTSGRVCVFEFKCYTDRLVLKLVIGPAHDQELRQRLFEAAWRETPCFGHPSATKSAPSGRPSGALSSSAEKHSLTAIWLRSRRPYEPTGRRFSKQRCRRSKRLSSRALERGRVTPTPSM